MKSVRFTTEEVQAVLEGRKTVMRRKPFHFVMKPGYSPDWSGYSLGEYYTGHIETGVCLYSRGLHGVWGVRSNIVKPLYQVGDILFVKEKFNNEETTSILYAADKEFIDFGCKNVDGYLFMEHEIKWRPSIHMPKEAARIFLKVTDVRVEQLKNITNEQVAKEGILPYIFVSGERNEEANKTSFIGLWNSSINKNDLVVYGWDANPWVFVYEFKMISESEAKND